MNSLSKCFRFLLFILLVVLLLMIANKPISQLLCYDNKTFYGGSEVAKYYIYPSDIDPTFKQQTSAILKNSDWNKYHKIEEVDSSDNADIHIYLKPREFLDKYHNTPEYHPDGSLIRFSITTQSRSLKPQIYIDEFNWLKGVKQSGLSLSKYRDYVINHEFGHGLGYDHQKCNSNTQKNKICPVMYQSTRGAPDGYTSGSQPIKADLQKRIPQAFLRY